MSIDDIRALPVADLAADDCHLWLWTTNRSLPDGFDIMKVWGFRYMAPITWAKPSGFGAWFVSRTQTLLFGYPNKAHDLQARLMAIAPRSADFRRLLLYKYPDEDMSRKKN